MYMVHRQHLKETIRTKKELEDEFLFVIGETSKKINEGDMRESFELALRKAKEKYPKYM